MTPENFCYWLQGRLELLPDTPISEREQEIIRDHLALVFHKVTPHRAEVPEKLDVPKPPPVENYLDDLEFPTPELLNELSFPNHPRIPSCDSVFCCQNTKSAC